MIPIIVKRTSEERINHLYHLVMIFMIGCFIGVIYETIYCYFQFGYFESRKGLIYGPFNAVYGLGAVVLTECLKNKKSLLSLFANGFLIGGIVEYMCSWIQETLFGSLSWDYSHYFLNFDGRTSVFHMIGWGIMAVLFMAYLYPIMIKVLDRLQEKRRMLTTALISSFFIINMAISGYANIRQQERFDGIKATNFLQHFFDKYYPDEFLEKIYPNKKKPEEIRKKKTP